jgi:hypothetical protein
MKNFTLNIALAVILAATTANAQSIDFSSGYGVDSYSQSATLKKPVIKKRVARTGVTLSTALPAAYSSGLRLLPASNFGFRSTSTPVRPRLTGPINSSILAPLPGFLNPPAVSSQSIAQTAISRTLYDF